MVLIGFILDQSLPRYSQGDSESYPDMTEENAVGEEDIDEQCRDGYQPSQLKVRALVQQVFKSCPDRYTHTVKKQKKCRKRPDAAIHRNFQESVERLDQFSVGYYRIIAKTHAEGVSEYYVHRFKPEQMSHLTGGRMGYKFGHSFGYEGLNSRRGARAEAEKQIPEIKNRN